MPSHAAQRPSLLAGIGTFGRQLAGLQPSSGCATPAQMAVRTSEAWLTLVAAPAAAPTARGAAKHRGERLLDGLHQLQTVLLGDDEPGQAMAALSEQLRGPRPEVDDPALASILDAIEQRAAVELAKMEACMAGQRRGA